MGFMNQRTQLGGSHRVVKGDWELLPRWASPWSCLITRGYWNNMGQNQPFYGDIMADHGRMKSTTCVGFLKMAWTPVLIQELHWSLANQWLKAVPFLMSKRRGSHLPFRAFLRGR